MTLALKARGIDLELFPPVVMSMIMGSLARMVFHEQGLGITRGHEEARCSSSNALRLVGIQETVQQAWGRFEHKCSLVELTPRRAQHEGINGKEVGANRLMLRLAKRTWVLLVILVVVLIAAFCVDRFRGFFGHTVLTKPGAGLVNDPAPFNPKVVKYEIFGDGASATINYLDLDAQPQKAENSRLAVVADPDHDGPRGQPEHHRPKRR